MGRNALMLDAAATQGRRQLPAPVLGRAALLAEHPLPGTDVRHYFGLNDMAARVERANLSFTDRQALDARRWEFLQETGQADRISLANLDDDTRREVLERVPVESRVLMLLRENPDRISDIARLHRAVQALARAGTAKARRERAVEVAALFERLPEIAPAEAMPIDEEPDAAAARLIAESLQHGIDRWAPEGALGAPVRMAGATLLTAAAAGMRAAAGAAHAAATVAPWVPSRATGDFRDSAVRFGEAAGHASVEEMARGLRDVGLPDGAARFGATALVGAVDTVTSLALARGLRLGMPGMYGILGMDVYNRSVVAGRDAGLTDGEAMRFAAGQAAAEVAFVGLFHRLGLGGVESRIMALGALRGLRTGLQTMGRTLLHELPEETLTQVTQQVGAYLEGLADTPLPSAEDMAQLVAQTVLVVGGVEGARIRRAGQARREALAVAASDKVAREFEETIVREAPAAAVAAVAPAEFQREAEQVFPAEGVIPFTAVERQAQEAQEAQVAAPPALPPVPPIVEPFPAPERQAAQEIYFRPTTPAEADRYAFEVADTPIGTGVQQWTVRAEPRAGLAPRTRRIVEAMEQVGGRPIATVTSPVPAAGWYDHRAGVRVLNVGAVGDAAALRNTVAHETVHALARMDARLFDNVLNAIPAARRAELRQSYRESYARSFGELAVQRLTEAQLAEEVVALTVGDAMTSPSVFAQALADPASRTVWRRALDWLMDRLRGLTPRGREINEVIRAMQAARNLAAEEAPAVLDAPEALVAAPHPGEEHLPPHLRTRLAPRVETVREAEIEIDIRAGKASRTTSPAVRAALEREIKNLREQKARLLGVEPQFLPAEPTMELIRDPVPPPGKVARIQEWLRTRSEGNAFQISAWGWVRTVLQNTNAGLFQAIDDVRTRAADRGKAMTADTDPELLLRTLAGARIAAEVQVTQGLMTLRGERIVDPKTKEVLSLPWLLDPARRAAPEPEGERTTAELHKVVRGFLSLGVAERTVEKARLRAGRRTRLAELRAQAKLAPRPERRKMAREIKALREELTGQITVDKAISPFFKQAQAQGITEEQAAQAYIDEAKKAPTHPHAQEFLRRYRLFADQLLFMGIETGYLSSETASRIKAANQYYMNMQRVTEDEGMTLYPGQDDRAVFHRFRGSDRQIDNPLVGMLATYAEMSTHMKRNEAWRHFWHHIKATESWDIAKQVPKAGPGTVTVRDGGEDIHLELAPDLAMVMYAQVGQMPDLVRLLLSPLSLPGFVMRAGITLSPAFRLRNLIRDTFHRLMRTPVGLWRGLDVLLQGISTEELRRARYELEALGGGVHLRGYEDAKDQYADLVIKRVKELSTERGTVLLWPKKMWDGWRRIGDMGEMANRVRLYQLARDAAVEQGHNPYAAKLLGAVAARDLADFAVTGFAMRAVNNVAYMPFVNAGIQGTVAELQLLRLAFGGRGTTVDSYLGPLGKRRAQAWTRITVFNVMPSLMALAFAASQGEDVLEEYRALPGWRRDLFFNFKIGDYWLSIPKGWMTALIGSTAERIVDKALGNPKALDGLFGSAVAAAIPLDESAALGPAGPIGSIMANYDFFLDRHIVPPWERQLSPSLRNLEGSGRTGTAISRALEAAGAEVHPEQIEFLVRRAFGSTGGMIMDAADIRPDMHRHTVQAVALRSLGVVTVPPGRAAVNVDEALSTAASIGIDDWAIAADIKLALAEAHRAADMETRNAHVAQARARADFFLSVVEPRKDAIAAYRRAERISGHARREFDSQPTPAARRAWANENPERYALAVERKRVDGAVRRASRVVNSLTPDLDAATLNQRLATLDDLMARLTERLKEPEQ